MLTVSGLVKTYGARRALDGFSLTVGAGEIVGLVGRNGAGKTTFVEVVTGLVRPDAGRVEIAGAPATRASRRLIGVAPQEQALYLPATVREHLRLFGALAGTGEIRTREIRTREHGGHKRGTCENELGGPANGNRTLGGGEHGGRELGSPEHGNRTLGGGEHGGREHGPPQHGNRTLGNREHGGRELGSPQHGNRTLDSRERGARTRRARRHGSRRFRVRELRAAIDLIAEELLLTDVLDRPVGLLSGGQRRRVQAACALLPAPPVLLLDEPTVGADPTTRSALLDAVRRRAAEGAAIVYTTHYLPELADLGATLAVADAGRVIARGHQADLLAGLPSTVRIGFAGAVPPALATKGTVVENVLHVNSFDPTATLAELLATGHQPVSADIDRACLDDLYRTLETDRHAA